MLLIIKDSTTVVLIMGQTMVTLMGPKDTPWPFIARVI